MSFDKARFIADFERVNGKTNKGQTYSVPSVVQPRVATPEEIAQRQNYQQLQNMFAPSKQYETDLARITNEINAISGYGAGADRSPRRFGFGACGYMYPYSYSYTEQNIGNCKNK